MGGWRAELAKSIAFRRKLHYGRLLRRMHLKGSSPEIACYVLMRKDNLGAGDFYHEGKFWGEINKLFRDLLFGGGLTNVRNEYFNRRFAGPDPSGRQVWQALLWVYYQKLSEIDTDGFLKVCSEPLEGGAADQELIDGRRMSLDFLQSVEEVYRLREAWALARLPDRPRLIVELGAGYGRLAYVCRKMLPDCSYVILDLPESLICSSNWLTRVLPGEVVPYDESREVTDLTRETLMGRKVWTLGAHQIERIASEAVDAFVNVYSFAEMPKRGITNYFFHLDRIIGRGVMYSKQRKGELNIADGLEINVGSYPVPPNWIKLFERTSTLYEAFFEVAFHLHDSSNI